MGPRDDPVFTVIKVQVESKDRADATATAESLGARRVATTAYPLGLPAQTPSRLSRAVVLAVCLGWMAVSSFAILVNR